MKALVGAFNQEKALVGAFSVIVQPVVESMEHYFRLFKVSISIASPFLHCSSAGQQRTSPPLSRQDYKMSQRTWRELSWRSESQGPQTGPGGCHVSRVMSLVTSDVLRRCVTRTASYSSDRDPTSLLKSPPAPSSPASSSGNGEFEGSERERFFESGTQVCGLR